MSRESKWIEAILHREFPENVEFLAGSRPDHVIVKWEVVGPDHAPRRNAPFVVIVDPEAIDRYEASDEREQARIEARVCELVEHRRQRYDPNGPTNVAAAFVVEIDEGDL
ncbi:hypothetical protein [Burkholderia pseudomallei]|uniref:hypothetical protein n=1 Tax=Burkholderia pseudomallei TaxID=28450 RepID=UPI002948F8A2|nr:hypothetical protein [Burkholderia pseudomallei]CAJ9610013.1 Uncharacterised protein [Burkholderia pseudomallei]